MHANDLFVKIQAIVDRLGNFRRHFGPGGEVASPITGGGRLGARARRRHLSDYHQLLNVLIIDFIIGPVQVTIVDEHS